MSIILNGVLLSTVTFVLKEAPKPAKEIYYDGILMVGLIGLVYNVGAYCVCLSSLFMLNTLTRRFCLIDKKLNLEVGMCRTRHSILVAKLGFALTIVFFSLWAVVWFALMYYRRELF